MAAAPDEVPAAALLIPKLNIYEAIVKVSAAKGYWDISQLGARVGWLETTGQTPDDSLAMAFVGHRTVSAGKMGPFAELWKLHVDDEVIYRSEGADYVYKVKHKLEVEPDETGRLYVKDRRQLLLVTCESWDYTVWNYSKRLIVVAEATGQRPAP
jgi:LPXTG-site transpeptidase (sortase) family protein